MRLIKCKACGSNIARNAKSCPNCGARVLHPVAASVATVLCIVFVLVVMYVTSHEGDQGLKQTAGQGAVVSPPVETPVASVPHAPETSGLVFGPGTYTVGQDIEAGTYDCIAVSGLGVLRGDIAAFGDPGFLQTMGSSSASVGGATASIEAAGSYSNLTLADGDVFYVEMNLTVEFVPK